MTCGVAFKEWAAICAAIAAGAQSIILRKGGIAETGGEFTPEHSQFWLYPTYYHEDRSASLKPEAKRFLDAAEASRTPGSISLQTLVSVKRVAKITTLEEALTLDSQHFWTSKTIEERFHYRTPGLYCLHIETTTRGVPHIVPESPAYAGCKTWVLLDEALVTGEA